MKRRQQKAPVRKRRERTEDVQPLRKVVSDEVELLVIERGRIVHPQRGGIALLHRLHRIYDGPNVIAIDLVLGARELKDIRKLDVDLERRMRTMLKGQERGNGEQPTYHMRVKLVAVIG